MIAYVGNEPFVFLSYSHSDKQIAEGVIVGLKRKMCRVFYDEGLTPGESWNDELAEKVIKCNCVVVLLTTNSVASKYVRSELNYAIAKDKTIIPILIGNTQLPPGIEMMLSPYQSIVVDSVDDTNSLENLVKSLTNVLPTIVFSSKKVPFLEAKGYSFYIEKYSVENQNNTDVSADCIRIICTSAEESIVLFEFEGTFAYDIVYSITQCKQINDDYFVGKIDSIYIINLLSDCCIKYPLCGPDFDCLMVISLRIPDYGKPSMCLIDYQYIHINQLTVLEGKTVQNSPWSQFLNSKIENKLYNRNMPHSET